MLLKNKLKINFRKVGFYLKIQIKNDLKFIFSLKQNLYLYLMRIYTRCFGGIVEVPFME